MESVRVGDYEVQHAIRWLGIWIDSKMTLEEHHSARMKKARKAMHYIRRLTGQIAMCPDACSRTLASVGTVRGRIVVGCPEGSGVKNRHDELQKLQNQLGKGIAGNLRTTNLGVVMAESGLRPAASLPNNRSRRHVLRLMSLPKGDQAKTLPGGDTAIGQRMVHFGEYSGWVEEIYLPEDGPTELGSSVSIADAEWAKQEARRADSQPLDGWVAG